MLVFASIYRFVSAALLMVGSSTSLHANDLDAGRTIFNKTAMPNCAVCHTLSDAGATGKIGPNLDTLKRTAGEIQLVVVNGAGVMPGFSGILSEAEIEAVSKYVAAVAGK
jgi:mono/diheme cytochrome c family protein